MKKFHFPLERVREWRENQVAIEEVRLEHLESERRGIEENIANLDREKAANEGAVLAMEATDALTLRSLDEFRRFARFRQAALERDRSAAGARIAEQRVRIMEAQRKVRLLDKLKARRRKLWNVAFDKEIEQQAAESYLARWNTGRQA